MAKGPVAGRAASGPCDTRLRTPRDAHSQICVLPALALLGRVVGACGAALLAVHPGGSGHPGASAGGAALESAALILAHAAPDTRVLSGLERPLEALVDYVATAAYGFRVFDLQQCRPGVPDREEQLRVLIAARGAVAPVHRPYSSRVSPGRGGVRPPGH